MTTQGSPIFAYLAHHDARQYDAARFGDVVPQHPSDEPADPIRARASVNSGSPTAMALKAARRRGSAAEDASDG